VQLINLSKNNTIEKIKEEYSIPTELISDNLIGLEIRNLKKEEAEVLKNTASVNYIYKKENNNLSTIKVLVTGKLSELSAIHKMFNNPALSNEIQESVDNYINYNKINYIIGNRNFSFDKVYVMGILNVTPDSFSDGGKFYKQDNAVNHAFEMIENGADIIDIGGESTRPGAESIDEDEEKRRVIPVFEKILAKFPDSILSIDTTKSSVAEEALSAGAKIVNDISGLTFDLEMVKIVKKHNAALIIMHIKGEPRNMQVNPVYENVVGEIYDFLSNQSKFASSNGIKNIFIDPGIGFGKTTEHNFELIKRVDDFKSIGCPLVIGLSRKSFIGKILKLEISERDTATTILEAASIINGARIIRTHNVQFGVQTAKLMNKLI
jgi:dihydropteroate synthase